MSDQNVWRNCGSCKKPIALREKYLFCSISTCKKSVYCSMPCFDAHSPIFRHKDAWAEERTAPGVNDSQAARPASRIDSAIIMKSRSDSPPVPKDVLVVASKLKDYIRAKSGLNTSANVLDRLSDMIRMHCDKACERAERDARKTVLDRDFYL